MKKVSWNLRNSRLFPSLTMEVFVFVGFLLFGLSAGVPSLPFTRMESARLLLSGWKSWELLNSSDLVDRRIAGAPCNVPLDDTRRLMYYRRFRLTLMKATDAGGSLRVHSHIASRLAFYQRKLGAPPLKHEPQDFCRSPRDDFTLSEDSFGLLWPPSPNFLVCYSQRCTHCNKVTQTPLKEACDIIGHTPPVEKIEAPSEAQELYERLKSVQSFPSEKAREKWEVAVEGGLCSATPLDTLAYVSLMKVLKVPLKETETMEEYEEEWRKIGRMEEEFEGRSGWKERFARFSEDTISSKVFCRTDLGAWSRDGDGEFVNKEAWLKGAYVCAGVTCKACKGRPLVEKESQVWTYEQGPLWKACGMLTELNGETEPEGEEPKEDCPQVGGAKECEPEPIKTTEKEEEPCEEKEEEEGARKETNFEIWLKSSGAFSRPSPAILLFGSIHVTLCILYL